jgi:hypothetical protein
MSVVDTQKKKFKRNRSRQALVFAGWSHLSQEPGASPIGPITWKIDPKSKATLAINS